MSTQFILDDHEAKELEETIKQYQEGAEEKINKYLHGKGYGVLDDSIHNAMPESGREWRGKKKQAKSAKSLQDKNKSEKLAVTIRATTAYGYLYFPNDGGNTKKHNGNQQFFEKGVEAKSEEVVNDMIELLKI